MKLPQWQRILLDLLRQRSDRLVGRPTNQDEKPSITFTVTHLPDAQVRVTLNDACDLPCVYDLCAMVTDACLDDHPQVVFTRAEPDHTSQTGTG